MNVIRGRHRTLLANFNVLANAIEGYDDDVRAGRHTPDRTETFPDSLPDVKTAWNAIREHVWSLLNQTA